LLTAADLPSSTKKRLPEGIWESFFGTSRDNGSHGWRPYSAVISSDRGAQRLASTNKAGHKLLDNTWFGRYHVKKRRAVDVAYQNKSLYDRKTAPHVFFFCFTPVLTGPVLFFIGGNIDERF
jgi:hypothetical protein